MISQTAVDRDEVKNATNMMISTEDECANMSEVATDLQTFAHRTLLLALSEITSPIVTFLFTVIQVLSFIWTIVLTVKFLKNDSLHLFRSAKHSSLILLTKFRAKRPSASADSIGVGAQKDLGGHQTFARKMTLINFAQKAIVFFVPIKVTSKPKKRKGLH